MDKVSERLMVFFDKLGLPHEQTGGFLYDIQKLENGKEQGDKLRNAAGQLCAQIRMDKPLSEKRKTVEREICHWNEVTL